MRNDYKLFSGEKGVCEKWRKQKRMKKIFSCTEFCMPFHDETCTLWSLHISICQLRCFLAISTIIGVPKFFIMARYLGIYDNIPEIGHLDEHDHIVSNWPLLQEEVDPMIYDFQFNSLSGETRQKEVTSILKWIILSQIINSKPHICVVTETLETANAYMSLKNFS